jgi:hypothetical protein
MWRELLVGAGVSAVNICIHALVMTAVVNRRAWLPPKPRRGILRSS